MTTYHENIYASLYRATEDQTHAGMTWYARQYNLAMTLTPDDVWRGAGIIAAYSPLTPWWRNVELATDSIRTGVARTDTLPNNYRAAARMLAGEHPLDVLNGTKTRHFAENIALNGVSDKVTVDSIAYSAAVGVHHAAKKIKGFGVKVYREIAEAYSDVAGHQGLAPCQIQAIVWCEWRDAHPNKGAVKGIGE